MKLYSLTEGEFSHACTSIAHHRDRSKRKHIPDGRADPTSWSASHARGVEADHQTMGRSPYLVPALWREAAPTGGERAPGPSPHLLTRPASPTPFSRPPALLSPVVR